jgi:hypothetical protein
MNQIIKDIDGTKGYFTDYQMQFDELLVYQNAVRSHYLNVLTNYNKDIVDKFSERSMQEYHELSHLLPHSSLWTKENRILPPIYLSDLKLTPFFVFLNRIFGCYQITGEDGIYEEELYWRIVRPNSLQDVGPLHADSWFWALSGKKYSQDLRRIKIWIPLFTEPGVNGFKFIEGSHLKKELFHYDSIEKDGKIKPAINGDFEHLSEIYNGDPGRPFIFNDDLIHGGAIGGLSTRVSLEFTILVNLS